MSAPTTSVAFSATLGPAAPAGTQIATPQSDNGTPEQIIDFVLPATGGVSKLTGSSTAAAGDCGKLLSHNITGAATLTLPATAPAVTDGAGVNRWKIGVQNASASTASLTVTATSPAKLAYVTAGSMVLAPGQGVEIFTDGTDYFVEAGSSGITQLTGDVTAGPGNGSQAATVVATHLSAPLPVAQGGTGTTTPSLVAGANVTITGTWPNQTVAASGGGGGGGTPSISITTAANPSTLNVTTEGTADWFVPNGTTALPRQVGATFLQAKVGGKTGGMIYNSFEWVGGAATGITIFTQNFTHPAVTCNLGDTLGSGGIASSINGQGLFTNVGGAVGYGFQLAVPALTSARTLRLYSSVFSGVVTCTASFADGSVTPVTATITAAAGTANESYFAITFTGAAQGALLLVTVLLTTNSGSGPNIKFMAATLA